MKNVVDKGIKIELKSPLVYDSKISERLLLIES